MPKPNHVQFFESTAQLRDWFVAKHASAPELWVGLHRKRLGVRSLTWPDVVDQALCFGWIDGVRHTVDATSYATRLTPRRQRSIWSAINIKRFQELAKLGLVTASGVEAFGRRDESRSRVYSYENAAKEFDAVSTATFRANPSAWEFFQTQPPSYRKTATHWVMSAKQGATRERRLGVLIASSNHRERIPPLARRRSSDQPSQKDAVQLA